MPANGKTNEWRTKEIPSTFSASPFLPRSLSCTRAADAQQSHNDKYRASLFNGEQEWHNNRKLSFIREWKLRLRRLRAMQTSEIAENRRKNVCSSAFALRVHPKYSKFFLHFSLVPGRTASFRVNLVFMR